MGSIGPEEMSHHNGTDGKSHGYANEALYEVLEQASRVNRRLRIVVIGCGASAINFAREVDVSNLNLDLTCYDKNPSIGGTWFENKYPGCGCDIPSVNYQFSWAPSGHWSSL